MSEKTKLVHLKNKYAGCDVSLSGGTIQVKKDGELLCALVKNCHGQWEDNNDIGARDAFSHDEIPRDARPYKLCKKDNCIKKDEEYDARIKKACGYVEKYGCVPSVYQLDESKVDYELPEVLSGKASAQISHKVS